MCVYIYIYYENTDSKYGEDIEDWIAEYWSKLNFSRRVIPST